MEYYCVGKVTKAHGIKGELFIHLFSGQADWLEQLEALVLSPTKTPENLQTFAIEKMRVHKSGLILKPKGVDDRNRAEALNKSYMQIPTSLLVASPGEPRYLHEYLGFTLVDAQDKPLGKIVDFSNNGAHDLFVVQGVEKVFEVPFVDEIVGSIDMNQKIICVDLPEGLMDL